MTFYIEFLDKSSLRLKDVLSYELTASVGIPCDSLRLYFYYEKSIGEACTIKAYDENGLVFNGMVDRQSFCSDENGKKCFLFARSSACVLVDNESIPTSYQSPSVSGLFLINASEFGFKNLLPELFCKEKYVVSSGTSNFSVLQNFVKIFGDYTIFINPKNEICVYSDDGKIKTIDKKIKSVTETINRGNPISEVCYRVNATDGYSHHLKSGFLENKKIHRKRLINLTNIPNWMRKTKASEKIVKSYDDYFVLKVVLDGVSTLSLYDTVDMENNNIFNKSIFFVKEKTVIKNENGEKTILIFSPKFNMEEKNYVAK